MIVKQDLVKRVKEYFNLNIYETKVWLALLTKGIVSAGEAAELSGVPRSRTYDVLESLEKSGFAIVKLGKPVKYIAVEPSTVLDKMKSNLLSEAQERIKTLSTLKETSEYQELEQLHKSGLAPIKAEDISGFVRGRQNMLSKLKEVLQRADKEICIYTSVADFENKSRILSPSIEAAQKKNIKVKVALSGDIEDVKRLNLKHGLKIRHGEHKGRYFMIDKKEVLFMLNSEQSEEELGVWLNSPFFTDSLDTMAEQGLRLLAKQ